MYDPKLTLACNWHTAGRGKPYYKCKSCLSLQARALRVMAKLGMGTFKAHPSEETYRWDGHRLRIDGLFSDPLVLWHEIGHFLSAPPARRNLPEYGIGAGPDFEVRVTTGVLVGVPTKAIQSTIKESTAEVEETCAALLACWGEEGFKAKRVLSLFTTAPSHIIGRALETLHSARVQLK